MVGVDALGAAAVVSVPAVVAPVPLPPVPFVPVFPLPPAISFEPPDVAARSQLEPPKPPRLPDDEVAGALTVVAVLPGLDLAISVSSTTEVHETRLGLTTVISAVELGPTTRLGSWRPSRCPIRWRRLELPLLASCSPTVKIHATTLPVISATSGTPASAVCACELEL